MIDENFRVLILDPSRTMCRLIETIVGQLYKKSSVTHADDADDVVKRLKNKSTYDFIFLDWDMASKANVLRAMYPYKGRSLIILTTIELTQAKINISLKAGANNCMQKPFDYDCFVRMITDTRKMSALLEAQKVLKTT